MPDESLIVVELKNSVPYWFEFIKLTVSILIGAALGYFGAFLQDRRNKKQRDEVFRKQQLSKGYILLDTIIVEVIKFNLWAQKITFNIILNDWEKVDLDSIFNTHAVECLAEFNLIITTFPEIYASDGIINLGQKFRNKIQEYFDDTRIFANKITELSTAEIMPTIKEFQESPEFMKLFNAIEQLDQIKKELQKEIELVLLKMNTS